MKKWRVELTKQRKGQILPLTLAALALGSLIMFPVLGFVSTGLKTGTTLKENVNAVYAADAGVEDAIWQLMYDRPDLSGGPYSYTVLDASGHPAVINGMTVDVVIASVTSFFGYRANNIQPHLDWVAIQKSNDYDAVTGQYNYVLTLLNTHSKNIKIQWVGISLPSNLIYVPGSTVGPLTNADPTITGTEGTGPILYWEIPQSTSTILTDQQVEHTFALTGPAGVLNPGGFLVLQVQSQDIGAISDDAPFSVVATAKNAKGVVQGKVIAVPWINATGPNVQLASYLVTR